MARLVHTTGTIEECAAESPTRQLLALDELRLSDRFRTSLSAEHVRALAAFDGEYPPILVTSVDHVVIDGLHRVHAARMQQKTTILCETFDGSDTDALVEFLKRNVVHGLPLGLAERREAARRILESRPDWSDRRIAGIGGLSPGAVGRLRGAVAAQHVGRRLGKDGRRRPENARALRDRIAEELKSDPEASLRSIASRVGASPETVRTVRRAAEQVTKAGDVSEQVVGADAPGRSEQRRSPAAAKLLSSVSLQTAAQGEQLVDLLSTTDVDARSLLAHVSGVPMSNVYAVADEARRRARCWLDFARALENRPAQRARAAG